MKKLLAILLAATMCVTLLAACGGQTAADMIYAVETGSAGEAAAKERAGRSTPWPPRPTP